MNCFVRNQDHRFDAFAPLKTRRSAVSVERDSNAFSAALRFPVATSARLNCIHRAPNYLYRPALPTKGRYQTVAGDFYAKRPDIVEQRRASVGLPVGQITPLHSANLFVSAILPQPAESSTGKKSPQPARTFCVSLPRPVQGVVSPNVGASLYILHNSALLFTKSPPFS